MDEEVFINATTGSWELAEYLELDSYPTSAFIDGYQNIIQKLGGFGTVERLLESAVKMVERIKISGSDNDLEWAYLKGIKDAIFLLEYIKVWQLQKMDNGLILDK